MVVPRVRTNYGDHSFSDNCSIIWNSLPHDLWSADVSQDSSWKRLKAFLFDTDTLYGAFVSNEKLGYISDIIIILLLLLLLL